MMDQALTLTTIALSLAMPVIGLVTLVTTKIASGAAVAASQRRFLAALIVITIMTLRTVIRCDDAWLYHTATLAMMIVGALVIPDQNGATDASVAL